MPILVHRFSPAREHHCTGSDAEVLLLIQQIPAVSP